MYIALISSLIVVMGMTFFSEPLEAKEETAIFGGGCFWCMEPPFEQLDGVIDVTAGYTGGTEADAVYKKVSAGITDHFEAVLVRYDPEKVSYKTLVETFWRQIDPTDDGGQFADRGNHYRTAIFITTTNRSRPRNSRSVSWMNQSCSSARWSPRFFRPNHSTRRRSIIRIIT